MKYLGDLSKLIINDDKAGIIKLVLKNRYTEISFEQFLFFTKLFGNELRDSFKGSFNNSGSGGSGISKPNISSISCIYVSAILKESIVKIGSAAVTSLHGSTDFFRSLGLVGISNKEYILKKYNFVYCDVLEIAPWKPYIDILSCNKYLKDILDNTIYHYYESKVEMWGVLGDKAHIKYENCKHINSPNKYYTYYSQINNICIDEIAGSEIYIDNKKINDISPNNIKQNYLRKKLTKQDIFKLNIQLLNAECEDHFWVDSLIKTIALALHCFEYSNDLQECISVAQKSYRDKSGKILLEKILGSIK